jgi:ATP-dependent Lon protease
MRLEKLSDAMNSNAESARGSIEMSNAGEGAQALIDERGQTLTVPILPLAGDVVLPRTIQPLTLQGEHASNVAQAAITGDGYVALFLNPGGETETTAANLAPVGTLAQLHGVTWADDGSVQVSAEGLRAVRLLNVAHKPTYALATVEVIKHHDEPEEQVAPLAAQTRRLFEQLLSLAGEGVQESVASNIETPDHEALAFLVAGSMPISPAGKQAFLETRTLSARFVTLISYLNKALQLGQPQPNDLNGAPMGPSPGAGGAHLDPATLDRVELEERLRATPLSPEGRAAADNELQRMLLLSPGSPEYNMARSYVGWLADLPWGGTDEAEIDLAQAAAVLDRDHYGLDDIKKRIIEHLAVRKLRATRSVPTEITSERNVQPVLCLVGPPGVGKTSLGRSIAEALGREFVRISLGGVSDEAEIRGHRRTYVGALPGRIVQSLARSKSHQPVIMLDELDKLSSNGKGDPSSALLDVLDPEQQCEFVDHYLGIPFDISSVFFVATANTLESVPEALRDRLEVIRLAGYTEEEKVQIANRHLIPRQMEWHALDGDDLTWDEGASRQVIQLYTREAGVRQLDREIATICRRVASEIAQTEPLQTARPQRVTPEVVAQILGTPRYLPSEPLDTDQPGVVTGAFWTAAGGDIMHIEALMMPGGKSLTVTGQLGDVMQESAQAALSYVRAHAEELGIDPDFYERSDIHIHIPSGAVAKDGPSAGVSIALALVSLMTQRPVRRELAVTGELTLRGKILPVGGIKEKLLAARRAGLKVVIIPAQNQPDLDDIDADLLADLHVILAETVEEALAAAF